MLVVDGDRRVLGALAALLRAEGLDVATAGDAEAARRLAGPSAEDGRRPQVALVDARLPDLRSGLDLIAELACRLPVVAISVDGAVGPAALGSGAYAFTEKDGLVETLVRLVATGGTAGRAEESRRPLPRPAEGACPTGPG